MGACEALRCVAGGLGPFPLLPSPASPDPPCDRPQGSTERPCLPSSPLDALPPVTAQVSPCCGSPDGHPQTPCLHTMGLPGCLGVQHQLVPPVPGCSEPSPGGSGLSQQVFLPPPGPWKAPELGQSSARGLGRHRSSSWPVGAGSEPLWCFPHMPPCTTAPCLPHLQRTGAHRDTRWGLGLHPQGPAESPGSYGLGSQLLTELGLVPCPAGPTYTFLPHPGGTPNVLALFSPMTCSRGS